MKFVVAVALVAALICDASAVLVAGWDFDPLTGGLNNFGPSPLAPTSSNTNVSVDGLRRGSGVGLGGATSTGAANAWGGTDFRTSGSSQSTAETDSELISFSVTANTGYKLSISDIGAYNVRRSNSGPTTGQWQYRVGSGSWTDIGGDITWGSTTTAAGNAKSSISLSSVTALQNVLAGTTVSFRALLWGASGATGTWYLNDPAGSVGNDFTLNGTLAAIPEPTAALFGGLVTAALGLTVARRPAQAA